MTWEREEWLAARREQEHRPHPADCLCRGCYVPEEEDEA